jgi:hypothetical protein
MSCLPQGSAGASRPGVTSCCCVIFGTNESSAHSARPTQARRGRNADRALDGAAHARAAKENCAASTQDRESSAEVCPYCCRAGGGGTGGLRLRAWLDRPVSGNRRYQHPAPWQHHFRRRSGASRRNEWSDGCIGCARRKLRFQTTRWPQKTTRRGSTSGDAGHESRPKIRAQPVSFRLIIVRRRDACTSTRPHYEIRRSRD